jgi:hypothetical protein
VGKGGNWRKLHNEQLRDLYSSLNIMRVGCVGYVAYMREKRNAYRVLMGKPKSREQLRRPKCRCEDNIKRYIQTLF